MLKPIGTDKTWRKKISEKIKVFKLLMIGFFFGAVLTSLLLDQRYLAMYKAFLYPSIVLDKVKVLEVEVKNK